MLETQIKTLNANIEKLNDLLTEVVKLGALPPAAQDYAKAKGVVSEPDDAPVEVQPEPVTEQPKDEITTETLQSECMRLVRENRDNKPKIKDVLSEFDVKTLTQLKPEQVAAAHKKITEACK